MNKKPNLKSLFAALQTDMVSKAQFNNVLNHPVDKGDNSEENWIKWFDDYLPKRYKAAKVTVVDERLLRFHMQAGYIRQNLCTVFLLEY